MLLLELYISMFILAAATFFTGRFSRPYALVVSGFYFLAFLVYSISQFYSLNGGFSAAETILISPYYGFNFTLQVSGFSALLVLLSLGVIFVAIFISDSRHGRVFFGLEMLTMAGLVGLLLSSNVLFFYIFWEVVLIPVYFLIGIFGGRNADSVSLKFFVYTHIGSVLMLLSFFSLYSYQYNNTGTFAMSLSSLVTPSLFQSMPEFWRLFVLFGFFVAFLVKLPSFPLHSWLPDSYEIAPYPVTIILAGALSIMGGYGLFGILLPVVSIMPYAFSVTLVVLGIVSLIYFSLAAMSQLSMKRMMAYASAAAMGFVTVSFGTSALEIQGNIYASNYMLDITGGMYQIMVHGLIMAFIFASLYYISRSTGKEMIGSLGGIFREAPILSSFLLAALLASLGLPGMAGFVAEFSILAGIYPEVGFWILLIIFGMLITASYHIWMAQRTLFGPYNENLGSIPDSSTASSAILVILLIIIVFLGVFPHYAFQLLSSYASGVI